MVEIQFDLECAGCGYNLRTLPAKHRCPECSLAVIDTIRAIGQYGITNRALVELVALLIGSSASAVLFVLDTVSYACAARGGFFRRRPTNARQLCDALRFRALGYFNDLDEARELLGEWGIIRSEDVGKIVYGLVDLGWLRSSEGDDPSHFDNLFTLDNLFDNTGGPIGR